MSKYRFAGTVKCVEIQSKSLIFSFIPDSEYSSVFRKDKDETMFALIQPVDKKIVGYVFEYSDAIEVSGTGTGTCPYLAPGVHCMLELDDTPSSGMYQISFVNLANAGKANSFGIMAITAL